MAPIAVLMPATILVVIGYFVLATSRKSDATLRTFGKYLSVWLFVLAGMVVIGAATAAIFGGQPFGFHGMMMRSGSMHGMMMKRSSSELTRPNGLPQESVPSEQEEAPKQ